MEFCVLASGSRGNCTYVSSGGTSILVDFGLSARTTVKRLSEIGVAPTAIEAVLFSHDHVDHWQGIETFRTSYPVRLFANEGTASSIDGACKKCALSWEIFETANTFSIGALQIEAFSLSHDAADTVGFVISDGSVKLGIVTDLGQSSPVVENKLKSCHAVILESNHDYEMLMQSERPWSLKSRINGRSGHLSNEDAAALIQRSLSDQLRGILLAHLSQDCNTQALARRAMETVLKEANRMDVHLSVLEQERPSARFQLTRETLIIQQVLSE